MNHLNKQGRYEWGREEQSGLEQIQESLRANIQSEQWTEGNMTKESGTGELKLIPDDSKAKGKAVSILQIAPREVFKKL